MDAPAALETWLTAHPPTRIAVLTGAGMSAESGIPTFRGADNLWRGTDPTALFLPKALVYRSREVWEMYDELRTRIARAEPHPGHYALAALARTHDVRLITQNIDGLHQRAGNEEVLELHGSLWRLRCTACPYRREDTEAPLPALPPACPRCGGLLRPDIVLYTESLPARTLDGAMQATETCEVMLVIGTSGVVYPAAGLPEIARARGATLIEINPTPTALSNRMHYALRAPAADALPWLVERLAV